MKVEKMIMITGQLYQEIKASVDNDNSYSFNIGNSATPQIVSITDIYLDTDPDFTRNPKQFSKVSDDNQVQVKIEYDEN